MGCSQPLSVGYVVHYDIFIVRKDITFKNLKKILFQRYAVKQTDKIRIWQQANRKHIFWGPDDKPFQDGIFHITKPIKFEFVICPSARRIGTFAGCNMNFVRTIPSIIRVQGPDINYEEFQEVAVHAKQPMRHIISYVYKLYKKKHPDINIEVKDWELINTPLGEATTDTWCYRWYNTPILNGYGIVTPRILYMVPRNVSIKNMEISLTNDVQEFQFSKEGEKSWEAIIFYLTEKVMTIVKRGSHQNMDLTHKASRALSNLWKEVTGYFSTDINKAKVLWPYVRALEGLLLKVLDFMYQRSFILPAGALRTADKYMSYLSYEFTTKDIFEKNMPKINYKVCKVAHMHWMFLKVDGTIRLTNKYLQYGFSLDTEAHVSRDERKRSRDESEEPLWLNLFC